MRGQQGLIATMKSTNCLFSLLLYMLFLCIMYMSSKGENPLFLPANFLKCCLREMSIFFSFARLFNVCVFNMIFLLELKLNF